jgi:mono/diheme cytochrome c family protein
MVRGIDVAESTGGSWAEGAGKSIAKAVSRVACHRTPYERGSVGYGPDLGWGGPPRGAEAVTS